MTLQFSNPNISEADQIPMVLQFDTAFAMRDDFRCADIFGCPLNCRVVLNKNAVVQHRHVRRRFHRPVSAEFRRGVNDILSVPIAHFDASVCHRRRLFVDAGGLSVGISGVLVAVQNL